MTYITVDSFDNTGMMNRYEYKTARKAWRSAYQTVRLYRRYQVENPPRTAVAIYRKPSDYRIVQVTL